MRQRRPRHGGVGLRVVGRRRCRGPVLPRESGRPLTTATVTTSGSASRRVQDVRDGLLDAAPRRSARGRLTVASSRCSVWNPRSIVSTCTRLRTSRPAPMSSISDSATSAATNDARSAIVTAIADRAALAVTQRRHELGATGACSAGTRPVPRPTTQRRADGERERPAVQRRPRRGAECRRDSRPCRTCRMPIATSQPSAAPDRAQNQRLGQALAHEIAAAWRRARRARRSRARAPDARASSRFVTLTQAISSSRPTAPSRIHSVRRSSSLAIHTSRRLAWSRRGPCSRGYCASRSRATRSQIRERRVEGHARLQAADDRRTPSCRDSRSAGARTARTTSASSSHGVPARQHADDSCRPAVEHRSSAPTMPRIAAEAASSRSGARAARASAARRARPRRARRAGRRRAARRARGRIRR